ncbi:hypothetical protein Tco_0059551 [Tanacetum coccineum]
MHVHDQSLAKTLSDVNFFVEGRMSPSTGSSTPPRYSPEASTPPSYSLGTSRNAECSNCKHLLDKITTMLRSNEYNTDDVVNENPQKKFHKWQKFMSFEPDIPETPVYKAKPNISKQYTQQSEVEKGNIFDNKEALILAVSNPENVRLTVLMKLQETLDEEAILEEQMLALMHCFANRFTNRRVEINNLMVLHDHPLVDYGKYALGCMTGADMKKCVYLKSVRDELLRSMEEKRQLMTNYRNM